MSDSGSDLADGQAASPGFSRTLLIAACSFGAGFLAALVLCLALTSGDRRKIGDLRDQVADLHEKVAYESKQAASYYETIKVHEATIKRLQARQKQEERKYAR